MARATGRVKPPDFQHVDKYALSALPVSDQPRGIPVVLGIDWYVEFDNPVKDHDGRYWVARDGKLTSIRGGHCICAKANESDPVEWWKFFNQGQEGACVGFGDARMKSLLDRIRYDAFELYHATRDLGHYSFAEGAFVRDALKVLQTRGAVRAGHKNPDPKSKISAYRWATDVSDILHVIDLPLATKLGAVPFLNSWGRNDYPHVTWMPAEVVQKLIDDDGEAGIVTDL
jgi:hypothetical protein